MYAVNVTTHRLRLSFPHRFQHRFVIVIAISAWDDGTTYEEKWNYKTNFHLDYYSNLLQMASQHNN